MFVDLYSRFPVIRYLKSTDHSSAIKAIDNLLAEYGNIEQLDTDNGPPFNAKQFSKFLENKGITHKKITPLWPQANRAETVMKGIKKSIQKSQIMKTNYRKDLNNYLSQYRATPHPSTGHSPATLLFNGRPFKTKIPTVGK